jgi:hypothetical protein
VTDLLRFAKAQQLIMIEDGPDPAGRPLDDVDRRWILTESGRKLEAPRGAGNRDLLYRLTPSIRSTYARIPAIRNGVTFLLVSGLGLKAKTSGTLMYEILVICALLLFIGTVVYGAFRDEQALTAMARSWPRMPDYRPARWAYETTRLRTPLPVAVFLIASVAAGGLVLHLLRNRHDVSLSRWVVGVAICLLLALAIGIYYVVFERRAERRRIAYRYEYEVRRKPPNQR